jgi:Dolichyl-phosphate-mannose-protein mannosyltransferase
MYSARIFAGQSMPMNKKFPPKDKKNAPGKPAATPAKTTKENNRPGFDLQGRGAQLLLGGILLFVVILRIRLLDMPFERDEGGFAYIGRHLFSGPPLYNGLYDNKLPGLYGLYALFVHIFGYSPTGVHLGLLLCNTLSCLLMYRWVCGRFNTRTALAAAGLFAVMSVSPNVFGFAAHATQLLLPFVFGGFLLLEKGVNTGRAHWFLFGGLLLGMAVIVKQSAAVFCVFAGLDLLLRYWSEKKSLLSSIRNAALTAVGVVFPFFLIAAYFASQGRFDDLWLWTIDLPATSGTANWQYLKFYYDNIIVYVFKNFEIVWGAAVLGLFALWFSQLRLSDRLASLLFFLLACGSVFLGLAFYPHYFVMALPAVALLSALLLDFLHSKIGAGAYWAGLLLVLLLPVFQLRGYYFSPNYNLIQRKMYGVNVFSELRRVGEELGRRSGKDQKIAVMGSEPEVLVYADRASATGHLFMYPIIKNNPKVEPFRVQYIDDLEKNRPEYIVFNTLTTSWNRSYARFLNKYKDSSRPIMRWSAKRKSATTASPASWCGIGRRRITGSKATTGFLYIAARYRRTSSYDPVFFIISTWVGCALPPGLSSNETAKAAAFPLNEMLCQACGASRCAMPRLTGTPSTMAHN